MAKLKTGGRLLIDALRSQDVDAAFCVPGESYLEVLDALYDHQDSIRLITCRHEGGAAFMAQAYGKLTGKPGICFVARGVGAANASVGVQTAYEEGTPLILFIGQVGRDMVERDAQQEVDYRRMFGQFTKWSTQIDDVARIAEYVSRAFASAISGRPGPVVIALPEDMLTDSAFSMAIDKVLAPMSYPSPVAIAQLADHLNAAERPLMIVGGATWGVEGLNALTLFAEQQDIPVAASFRRRDLFDNRRAQYVGELGIDVCPALASLVGEADLIVAVGARLGEITTSGYTLIDVPRPHQTLVHVLPSADDLGRIYQPQVAIPSSLDAFARCAVALPVVANPPWKAWRRAARDAYEAHVTPVAGHIGFDPAVAFRHLKEMVPDDTIITHGAGNHASWADRYYPFLHPNTQLASINGAVGYGVPAAIAAKLCFPDRQVVCLAGDGCFLMHSQELATAVRYRLSIIFLVFNNGMYGSIRMQQEKHYPGRVIASDLTNPDFAVYAKAFGMAAAVVEQTADFEVAFAKALETSASSRCPYLIEIRSNPELTHPGRTLSELRAIGLADRADVDQVPSGHLNPDRRFLADTLGSR